MSEFQVFMGFCFAPKSRKLSELHKVTKTLTENSQYLWLKEPEDRVQAITTTGMSTENAQKEMERLHPTLCA